MGAHGLTAVRFPPSGSGDTGRQDKTGPARTEFTMRTGGRATTLNTTLAIVVAALGYFVDVFDIWLFSSVRKQSLEGLGLIGDDVTRVGAALLNWQMAGFILGAILFGIVADRRGRLTVLFASILTYSVANVANGFVHGVAEYAVCRFVAGIGLAGELGAGIALVSELVSTAKRGWATTFVATVGVLGSVAAPLVAGAVDWRTAYFIGGGMGLLLLLMRVGVFESGMFEEVKSRDDVKRGDFRHLLETGERRRRYLAIILAGGPVWFFAGLMMTFSPEVQAALSIPDPNPAPKVIAIAALGLCIGDLIFGGLSQLFRSRRVAFWIAYVWMATAVAGIFLFARTATAFFWLMGSDNALAFPRWWRWRDIAAETPIAVIARPGSEISARLSPAAQKLARAHPFVFIEAQLHPASATAIRAKGLWPAAR